MISAEHFEDRVGRPPENDDLERSNCPIAGEVGHWGCGWAMPEDLPVFMVSRAFREAHQRG
jgi:hypothetical protein